MILEYMPKMLFDVCQAHKGKMSEDFARYFMKQIVSGVNHMHKSAKVIHRDLKLENILVDEDLKVQICDFGFAASRNISTLKGHKGTKSYMAPEIKQGKVYDGRKVDIFSLGVIMFILATG